MTHREKMMRHVSRHTLAESWCPDGLYRLDYSSSTDSAKDWALLLPPAPGHDTWIVNLHGHGATGDQLYTRADLCPRKNQFLRAGLGILTPNLRGNAWMCPEAVHDLHALLHYARTEHAARNFIFYSGSMGGTGTLIYAVQHPEDVATLVALCPATDLPSYHNDWLKHGTPPVLNEIRQAIQTAYHGTPKTHPELFNAHSALKNAPRLTMPIALVHGDADPTIPVTQTRKLLHRLHEIGATVTYRELPNGHHDSPITGADGMLEWAMEQAGLKL